MVEHKLFLFCLCILLPIHTKYNQIVHFLIKGNITYVAIKENILQNLIPFGRLILRIESIWKHLSPVHVTSISPPVKFGK